MAGKLDTWWRRWRSSRAAAAKAAPSSGNSELQPCADKGQQLVTLDNHALSAILDWGESMLVVGADVSVVESEIREMGQYCGASYTDVMALSSLIVVTLTGPHGETFTQSRRIDTTSDTDFSKLDDLYQLCGEFCAGQLSVEELERQRVAIMARPFPKISLYLGGILGTSCFVIFFGGTLVEAGIAAAVSILACLMMSYVKPRTPNNNVFNFLAAFVTGLVIAALAKVIPGMDASITIVGVIMILVPGIALTNSARDMISGDVVTGMIGFVESVLWTTSLALGYIAALALLA